MSSALKTILLIILIILIGFAAYFNTLPAKFIWDDGIYIVENSQIKNWANLPKIFSQDPFAGSAVKYASYRPVQTFTNMLDYTFWRLNPAGYHLTNILLHIISALCVFWLVKIIFASNALAFLTAALFSVHPVHSEAVAYISGRSDSLAFLFMFLCFISYVRQLHLKSSKLYLLMLISYALALLSRENSLILPALILLYHFVFKIKVNKRGFISLLALVSVYLILRLTVLKSLLSVVDYPANFWQRFPGFFAAITNYLLLLIYPVNLHYEYGWKLFSLFNPKVIAGAVILSGAIIYALRIKDKNKLFAFALLWFFIALLPVSNLFALNAYMAEHWLYLPSVGFFLILAKGLLDIYAKEDFKITAIALSLVFIITYALFTLKQNSYWREPLVFYKRTLAFNPDSPRIMNNLANLYRQSGNYQKAISLYERAIKLSPGFAEIYNNLGNTYKQMGELDKAKANYDEAIRIDPTFSEVYNNLGLLYKDSAMTKEAIEALQKSIQINPRDATGYNNLACLYKDAGDYAKAIAYYNKALVIDPDFAEAYYNLGNLYKENAKLEEAASSYKKALIINPDYLDAYNNLGIVYIQLGKNAQAIEVLKKAIRINPQDAFLYNNLASVYKDSANWQEAVLWYKKAVEIDPGNPVLYYNLAVTYFDLKDYSLAVKYCDQALALGYKVDAQFLQLIAPHRDKQ